MPLILLLQQPTENLKPVSQLCKLLRVNSTPLKEHTGEIMLSLAEMLLLLLSKLMMIEWLISLTLEENLSTQPLLNSHVSSKKPWMLTEPR